jgi:Ca2+-binding EF-hand superfamily protein
MKVSSALLGAALIILAISQVFLFQRVNSLARRFDSLVSGDLRAGDQEKQVVDRRLAAMKRAVEGLASEVRKRKDSPEPALPAAAAAPKEVASAAASVPHGEAEEAAGIDAEEEEEDGKDEGPVPENLAPPLAQRRKVLEEIRARLGLLDKNSDRQISLKEFEGDIADFLYLDKNSSGRISQEEIKAVMATEDSALRRVAQADRNSDGQVSPDEFRGSARKFRYLDANQDAGVTPDEYVTAHRRLRERLDGDDMDNDHRLSKAEYGGGAAKFEKFDANRDGFIDRSELKEMLIQGH